MQPTTSDHQQPDRPGRRTVRVALVVALVAVVLTLDAPALEAVPAPSSGGAVPSAGCGTSSAGPETEVRYDVDLAGTTRWYLRTVPPNHDGVTPIPLVLDFHGLAEGAQIHTAMSSFSALAVDRGFAVVFPHGQFDPVRWDLNGALEDNRDVDLVDTILATLGEDLCLDLSRVYASGLSYGAWMTWFLSCHRSDVLAAIAPVAGVRTFDPCPRTRPVPAVAFHGTDDPILPIDEAAIAARAADNGCDGFADVPVSDEVVRRVFDCPDGADVEFYVVEGGGHAWPGSEFSRLIEPVVGYTTFDIDATAVAWAFFERFQLPCETTGTCPEDPDDSDDVGPTTTSTSGVEPATGPAALAAGATAGAPPPPSPPAVPQARSAAFTG